MNNPYLAKISVVRITPANKGNVKAFASVRLGQALTINSIKIIQQAGQKAYVRLPEQEANGKYFPVVSADDRRFQEAVQELVLTAWRDGIVTGANGNGE